MLSNKNRDSRSGPKRDGIGWAGVDLQKLPIKSYLNSCIECMLAKVVDYNSFNLTPHMLNYTIEQLMRQRTGRRNPFQPAVNGKDLGNPDYNGKTALALSFLKDYYLLVGAFINDYTRQLNFDIHYLTVFQKNQADS